MYLPLIDDQERYSNVTKEEKDYYTEEQNDKANKMGANYFVKYTSKPKSDLGTLMKALNEEGDTILDAAL